MRSAIQRVCGIIAQVTRVSRPCAEHVEVEFEVERFPPSAPGQFLQLSCRDPEQPRESEQSWEEGRFPRLTGAELCSRSAFLRRPFSIEDRWSVAGGRDRMTVLSRRVGVGTEWLDQQAAGKQLSISGPFGRPFDIPREPGALILIGGGVGIPPLIYLSRRLAELRREDVTLIFGAMRRDLFPVPLRNVPSAEGAPSHCLDLAHGTAFDAIITCDDGSLGMRGRVTEGLAALADRRADRLRGASVLACGPEPMLHALARQTRKLELACQLCIERTMGCGLGTCLSCVARVVDAARPSGWRWALSCSEGPVFERDRLLDYAG